MAKDSERRLLVSYEAGSSGKTSAVARDVSLGGLFVETKRPLAVGALLTVEIDEGRTKVVLDGRVISKTDAGMTVAFLDLPSSTAATLQSILAKHRPPQRTRIGVGDDPLAGLVSVDVEGLVAAHDFGARGAGSEDTEEGEAPAAAAPATPARATPPPPAAHARRATGEPMAPSKSSRPPIVVPVAPIKETGGRGITALLVVLVALTAVAAAILYAAMR